MYTNIFGVARISWISTKVCKNASILSWNIFDPNLTWPKLFQTERTRRLAHLPSFCELVFPVLYSIESPQLKQNIYPGSLSFPFLQQDLFKNACSLKILPKIWKVLQLCYERNQPHCFSLKILDCLFCIINVMWWSIFTSEDRSLENTLMMEVLLCHPFHEHRQWFLVKSFSWQRSNLKHSH